MCISILNSGSTPSPRGCSAVTLVTHGQGNPGTRIAQQNASVRPDQPRPSRKVDSMPGNNRVLLAVDASEESRRAVAYVADMLGGRPGFRIALLHLEEPPRMLEWGGSENPRLEDRVSAEREEAFQQNEKEIATRSKSMLQRYQAMLADKGIDAIESLVQFDEPLTTKNIAAHLLKTAEKDGYGTVVVGRHLFSLWERLFQRHVGEQLVRRGEGITIWVVG
jgi:hypothetical protein